VAIFSSLASTVGRTPLIELHRFASELNLNARILGKLESKNPTSSVKDRIAVAMIEDAAEKGVLKAGGMIVSASSGNTGIALASAAAALGYSITVVMPTSMGREREALLRRLGARVELTPGSMMADAVARAEEIVAGNSKAVKLRQFENLANPLAHRRTTAVEIWQDCEGELSCFVSGVGTGGTLVGVGGFLKEKDDHIRVVAVEPEASAVLSGNAPGPHFIQGIGAGFIPKLIKPSSYDEVITVSDQAAREMSLRLSRTEGILAGMSTGANLAASVILAKRPEMAGKTIVTIICDSGERYLSSALSEETEN